MRLSSSGPSRQPGVPSAVSALTFRSLNLACSFHMLCANPMASSIVSWKSLYSFPILSQVSWRSPEWNCASSLIENELFHSVPNFRPCEKNFRFPRILMNVSPGIAPPIKYTTLERALRALPVTHALRSGASGAPTRGELALTIRHIPRVGSHYLWTTDSQNHSPTPVHVRDANVMCPTPLPFVQPSA